MSVKRIAKEVLKINPNLEGYFRYNIDNNTYYQGKIRYSKRNGFGTLYRDGKVLWQGMWIDDNKIDDNNLPNEVPIKEKELILELNWLLHIYVSVLTNPRLGLILLPLWKSLMYCEE